MCVFPLFCNLRNTVCPHILLTVLTELWLSGFIALLNACLCERWAKKTFLIVPCFDCMSVHERENKKVSCLHSPVFLSMMTIHLISLDIFQWTYTHWIYFISISLDHNLNVVFCILVVCVPAFSSSFFIQLTLFLHLWCSFSSCSK